MSAQDKFVGWIAHDAKSIEGTMTWEEYTPKKFTEDDVEGDIIACGICWSDLSTMSDGWGNAIRPLCPGHEIAMKITRVGKNVNHLQVGQRAAVGAQSDSCRECHTCKADLEPYCCGKTGIVGTYNGKYADGSGQSFGGYAKKWRGPGHFAIPIPDGLPSHEAACLACGGVTIYSPLKNYGCGQPGVKRVGIVGIGGIGAFGVAFAKALGAETIVAIGHTASKKDLAMDLGATDFVATGDGKSNPLVPKYRASLDLIIVTANNADQRYDYYLQALRPLGHLINVAIPEEATMPIPIGGLCFSGASIGGSAIGGPKQIAEMYALAAEKKPKFLIEKRDMKDANQAVVDMSNGKPRFRYALINEGVE